MTASSLRNYSCKHLAQMAKSEGLPGWHSMRKDELVRAPERDKRERAVADPRHALGTIADRNLVQQPPTLRVHDRHTVGVGVGDE